MGPLPVPLPTLPDIQIEPDFFGIIWDGLWGELHPEYEVSTAKAIVMALDDGAFVTAKADLKTLLRNMKKYGEVRVDGIPI